MLVAYQNPRYVERSRASSALRRRLLGPDVWARHRDRSALGALVSPSGNPAPVWVNRRRDLSRGPFVVPLNVVAYYYLMPGSDKNKGSVSVFEALSRAERQALDDHDARLLLTLHTEVFFPRVSDVELMHSELSRWPFEPSRIFIVNCNLKSEDAYLAACRAAGVARPVNMVAFDWFRHKAAATATAMVMRPAPCARRPYKFVTFNGQTRPHRTCLVLFLLSRGLESSGRVSFLNHGSKGPLTKEGIDDALRHFSIGTELDEWYDQLIARAPIILDADTGRAGDYFASQDAALYDSTYFSIVTDTSFVDDNMLFITEKVYKPIVNLHPFVYMGNCGALGELRRQGFATFSPLIDESYDDEADNDHRMTMILHEVERLARLSLDELHDLYWQLHPRLVANRERLVAMTAEYPHAAQHSVWDRLGITV